MWQKCIIALATLFTASHGQRITTIQLDGIQYFISRMNPYTPELNWFMSYQYCRSIGLQLSSFESREKSDSITQYLTNAGYNKYDFWTSGNRIGTDMFLWMSTGLPFNATFNLMKSQEDNQPLLGTMPLGRKKRLDSGISDACVAMKSPDLIWDTEDCSSIKDFICEQTRCYYYNYGSIPVSSSQGNKSASASNTRLYSTPLPLISSTTMATFVSSSSPTHFYTEHITESTNQEEENSSDDYFNENNYVRILNNYRKVADEEVNGRTEDSADVAETPALVVTSKTPEAKKELKKSSDETPKENLNKRSGEIHATPVKAATNRMELKENLMKTVQNKNSKVVDKQAVNKNLYKKNADGSPRKPLDELRKADRTTEQYVSVATTEYFETEEEKKIFMEHKDNHKRVTTESNELPAKGKDAVKAVEKDKLDRPAPTVATGTPIKDAMHTKASENIINSIRNIMNNTHHMKQANSEIHDAQIIVKAPGEATRFNTKHDGKKTGVAAETKSSTHSTVESATDIDEAKPTTNEKLEKNSLAHAKSPVPDLDEKIRLRNTKVLEPTENDARAMPENLSNAFPWSWAKDILLEKPVAKKTAPNVEDIIADIDS